MRHGDPNYAEDCLTERGKREAAALAEYAPCLGLTHIYASPMGRAQQTAQATADVLSLPITTLDWAKELTGIYYDVPGFRRHSPFTMPGEVMYRNTPQPLYEGWNTRPYSDDPFYTQRMGEIIAGSDALLASHGYCREGRLYRCENANEDRIAVFCHHGLAVTWLSHLLTIPVQAAWAGFWLACTSVTAVVMERHSLEWSVPRALGVGDVSHIRMVGLDDNECGFFERPKQDL